jgi:hypothetical protein
LLFQRQQGRENKKNEDVGENFSTTSSLFYKSIIDLKDNFVKGEAVKNLSAGLGTKIAGATARFARYGQTPLAVPGTAGAVPTAAV